jgi:hypothetical protein
MLLITRLKGVIVATHTISSKVAHGLGLRSDAPVAKPVQTWACVNAGFASALQGSRSGNQGNGTLYCVGTFEKVAAWQKLNKMQLCTKLVQF